MSNNFNPSKAQISDLLADPNVPPPPKFKITNVSIKEGNSGLTKANFVVQIILPPNQGSTPGPIPTVKFATADGKAKAGKDYVATQGTLTFAQGQTKATITVDIKGDKIVEKDEKFFINLYTPDDKLIKGIKGTGTIKNDDKKKSKDVLLGNTSTLTGMQEAHSFKKSDEYNDRPNLDNINTIFFNSETIRLTPNTLGTNLTAKSLENFPNTQGLLTLNPIHEVFTVENGQY